MEIDNKKSFDNLKHISDIKKNYRRMEEELVTQLNYELNNHHVTAGGNREEIWKTFFRRIIPKKFNIARSVFIIDSNDKISKEVDIAIYDEQYTPYIFNYGLIKFIPIEAVSAVVQCKSKNLDKDALEKWSNSIKILKTSNKSIVRLATKVHIGVDETNTSESIMRATTPIKILCYIPDNESFNQSESKEKFKESFDIIIEAFLNPKESYNKGKMRILFNDKDLFQVLKKYNNYDKELNYNLDENISRRVIKKSEREESVIEKDLEKLKKININDYEVKENKGEEYSLLSFIFQFNQMLMMINNPMFFPHIAYVDMFNKHQEKGE